MRPWPIFQAVLLCLMTAHVAMACRYTVREIGFVNLDGRPWTLVQVGTEDGFTPTIDPIETNLGTMTVDPVLDPNHPAVRATSGKAGFVLLGPDGRTMALGTNDPHVAANLSIESPIRTRIANHALDTFAFVLVIPGPDKQENQRARSAALSAQQQLTALAPHLPRPVANPLSVIELSSDDLRNERVLLCSV